MLCPKFGGVLDAFEVTITVPRPIFSKRSSLFLPFLFSVTFGLSSRLDWFIFKASSLRLEAAQNTPEPSKFRKTLILAPPMESKYLYWLNMVGGEAY